MYILYIYIYIWNIPSSIWCYNELLWFIWLYGAIIHNEPYIYVLYGFISIWIIEAGSEVHGAYRSWRDPCPSPLRPWAKRTRSRPSAPEPRWRVTQEALENENDRVGRKFSNLHGKVIWNHDFWGVMGIEWESGYLNNHKVVQIFLTLELWPSNPP